MWEVTHGRTVKNKKIHEKNSHSVLITGNSPTVKDSRRRRHPRCRSLPGLAEDRQDALHVEVGARPLHEQRHRAVWWIVVCGEG